VDGEKLVEMFQRVELGVKLKTVYEVPRMKPITENILNIE
jgi:hypothetical protein